MENKKPTKKLIVIFVTILALCALILIAIFYIQNSKKDVYSNNFTEKEFKENTNSANKTDKNEISTDKQNSNGSENNDKSVENGIKGTNQIETGNSDGTEGTGASGTAGTGEGNGTTSGNGNASSGTLSESQNGNSIIGTRENQSSGSGTSFTQDENGSYKADVEMESNPKINEIITKNGTDQYTFEYLDDQEEDSNKSNIKEYEDWIFSVKDNDYSNLTVKLNLLNAPYHNDEYCEEMLTQKYFDIKLTSKPEGSICKNYPERIAINDNGSINIDKHIYTKTGNIDLSNTYFNMLGDYIFSIYPEGSNNELYQIVVSLRGVTSEDGTPQFRTYSLIQIKSMLQDGNKVNNININVKNPNTSITIDKIKNVNSFWEQVYVDLYIDSYENERYTVVDGNSINETSAVKVGEHYVVRTANGNIIPQTYKLANDGKIIVGRKAVGNVACVTKVASVNGLGNLNIANTKNSDIYEIPAGTKFKAEFSAEKRYREDYDIEGGGEYRVAKENAEENRVKILNLTSGNPKTGIFYNIIPFIIVLAVAVMGVIIIKNISTKNKNEDNNE